MTDEVLVQVEGRAGRLSLNRPEALHALNVPMVQAMTQALLAWRVDPTVEVVLIDHAEGRGFCAGGDIAFLRNSALSDGGARGRQFFHAEYQLNHLLFVYAKPVVAFMNGVTMGGGVGISQPARYRVVTEHTRLAMPETGIGLFPDVGGGWYLSRLPGRIGEWLALTGARLDGAECFAVGLATHYLPSERLALAKERIAAEPMDVDGILGELSVAPPEPKMLGNRPHIDRLFGGETLEDILSALEADGGAWAAKELTTLRMKSPQTCKVALRQLAEARRLTDFADELRMEYRIGSRVLTRPDFAEGVRAVIVDKDNAPRWNPATPEGVTNVLLDEIFAPLANEEEWKPL